MGPKQELGSKLLPLSFSFWFCCSEEGDGKRRWQLLPSPFSLAFLLLQWKKQRQQSYCHLLVFSSVPVKKVLLPSPFVLVLLHRRRQSCCRLLLFSFYYIKKGDGNFVAIIFFYFCFVVTKKAMVAKLSLPSCFLFCCSEEGDGSIVVAFFFWFCCSKEGDSNFSITFFCFGVATMKKLLTYSTCNNGIMGGNGIRWRVYVNGNLMNVNEYGIEKLKGKSDKKRNDWWLSLMKFSFF